MSKPYQRAFPDFPAADMPIIPAGFRDRSWRNEPCPCFMHDISGILLHVDFADPEKREFPSLPRFRVQRCLTLDPVAGWQVDDKTTVPWGTDTWELMLQYIAPMISPPVHPTALQWTTANVESAMCLWEAFELFRSRSGGDEGQRELAALCERLTDEEGTAAARHVVISWVTECEALWNAAVEADEPDMPFDWEHCPNFLAEKLRERYATN